MVTLLDLFSENDQIKKWHQSLTDKKRQLILGLSTSTKALAIASSLEKENKIESLIKQEKLKDKAHRFIEKSISNGYVEYAGEDLDKIIPPTSRRHGAREKKKASILEKIRQIVEVFVGI